MERVRRFAALGLLAAVIVLIPSVMQAGPTYGRSVVGVARRTDGAVTVVTAWCIGSRSEDLRIASYLEAQHGDVLYRTTGPSSDPLTVATVGRPVTDFDIRINKPFPGGPMVAYNAGARRDWLVRRTYPSTATVFVMEDLPVSDAAVPEKVMVGHLKVVTVQEMIAAKCVDPG